MIALHCHATICDIRVALNFLTVRNFCALVWARYHMHYAHSEHHYMPLATEWWCFHPVSCSYRIAMLDLCASDSILSTLE